MAETIGDRLRQVRGSESQPKFAAKFGVDKDLLGKYERNVSVPGGDVLARLHRACGVDINWLLTGQGEMHASQSPHPAAGAPGSRDPDLYGRVLEAISAVYKELGWGISLRQIGAEAAQIADDIAAEGLAPEDKPPAVKAAAVMLRRQLRAAAVDPTAEASTKDRA